MKRPLKYHRGPTAERVMVRGRKKAVLLLLALLVEVAAKFKCAMVLLLYNRFVQIVTEQAKLLKILALIVMGRENAQTACHVAAQWATSHRLKFHTGLEQDKSGFFVFPCTPGSPAPHRRDTSSPCSTRGHRHSDGTGSSSSSPGRAGRSPDPSGHS